MFIIYRFTEDSFGLLGFTDIKFNKKCKKKNSSHGPLNQTNICHNVTFCNLECDLCHVRSWIMNSSIVPFLPFRCGNYHRHAKSLPDVWLIKTFYFTWTKILRVIIIIIIVIYRRNAIRVKEQPIVVSDFHDILSIKHRQDRYLDSCCAY